MRSKHESLAIAVELDRLSALLMMPTRELPTNEYERGMRDTFERIAKSLAERAATLRAEFAELQGAIRPIDEGEDIQF